VFKDSVISLITGDAVTGDLAQNIISSSVGCSAGRTVSATPKGLMFMANDGIRTIGHDGRLGDPYPDLKIPFIYALTPSRSSACYNNNIYRITIQNGHADGSPFEEYWFNMRQNGWTGPHSFTQDMSTPYSNTFISFRNTVTPALFTSDAIQSGASIFVENGSAMDFKILTSPLPDTGTLYENSAILSVIDMQVPQSAQSYTFVASDVASGVLSTAIIAFSSSGAIWNGFTWGVGTWTSTVYGLERYNIPWTTPLVFSRMVWQVTGASIGGLKIGKLAIGYQPLKYVRAL
jgi:hypothetical protein